MNTLPVLEGAGQGDKTFLISASYRKIWFYKKQKKKCLTCFSQASFKDGLLFLTSFLFEFYFISAPDRRWT